ncbi:hypothetical protein SESBI_39697 [Sesbania bispinosa]|nr:hypothetical protein SESBI_39697 [Sesbania bispinosa]
MAGMESLLWSRFSMGDDHLFPHATAIKVLKTPFSPGENGNNVTISKIDTRLWSPCKKLHSLLISLCQDSCSFTPLLWRPCSATIARHQH